jgi:hypothetical protein
MIAKEFICAKIFRAYGTNFFRQNKNLRDHRGGLSRSTLAHVTPTLQRTMGTRGLSGMTTRRQPGRLAAQAA